MDTEINFDSVDALVASKKYAEAEAECRELMRLHPNRYRVFSKLAHIVASAGRNSDAIRVINDAIALDQKQPALWWKLGTYLLNDGSSRDAVDAFSEAISLSEAHSDPYYRQVAYFLRAEAHCRGGNYRDAESDLRNVEDNMFFWLDRPISKDAILEKCAQHCNNGLG